MIRKLLIAFGSLAVLGYLGLSGYAYFHDTSYAERSIPQASNVVEGGQIRRLLDEKACYYCHSRQTVLPAYARLPGMSQLSRYDVERGLKNFQIDALFDNLRDGTPPAEADLAKLEFVASDGSMPPRLFRSVHWSTGLSDSDRRMLLDWIASQRKAYYATPGVAPEFSNEPVQPLPKSIPVDARKVSLGRELFHDPRLSADNTISCASCHALSKGGVDGRKTSLGVGGQVGPINAPTVFNAVLNRAQFWDGRADGLQAQAGGPPLNPIEMASTSWQQIIDKLNQDPSLTRQFEGVYPDGYSGKNITNAIAEFEKTLLTPSRFDAYLRGDKTALSAEELHGYQLFKANRCATCHVGKNLGGQSFERLGLHGDYFADRDTPMTTVDNGRENVSHDAQDFHRFKTPTLRNIALTAPYLHDGSVTDLSQAVRIMLKYQVGKDASDDDVKALVAFLNSLTGK
ncbi:cytochrome C peroxidase (cpp-like) [Paraburkholderia ribeironis]|uniref:Cytochrome C peroxidase (Cpp-like) n=1 Tax=Paraburkholderia ribeironis TaxID=1247936 RepID=A0A1N7SDG5_9BURK|nr:cytochrome c peroxidase [Paraburkholderia ribeironis]SIT45426.1 cytochrome C peroxidase (cpp-like) [Paraburkholderia ribeironis]